MDSGRGRRNETRIRAEIQVKRGLRLVLVSRRIGAAVMKCASGFRDPVSECVYNQAALVRAEACPCQDRARSAHERPLVELQRASDANKEKGTKASKMSREKTPH